MSSSSNPEFRRQEELAALQSRLAGGEDSDSQDFEQELAEAAEVLRMLERAGLPADASIEETPGISEDATRPAHPGHDLPIDASPGFVGRRIGKFKVEKQVGQGGYGMVFLARDLELDRDVALKVPHPETLLTEERQSRFLREGKAAGLLSHPNVVPVYETGRIGRVCLIVSAFVDGVTLSEWLASNKQECPEATAAGIVATLAEAVQHAHSKGVFHRDLKPSNIMLATDVIAEVDDLRQAVRVTDFGLAKVDSDATQLTQTNAMLGTPAYMPPERVGPTETRGTSAAGDVYSLGVILYEMLAGRPPFVSDSILETLQLVKEEEPPRIRNRHVSSDLEAICFKCLEKSPERRYKSAEELRDDLERFLRDEPVNARPISSTMRAIRWCRKRPALAAVASALAISLIGGGMILVSQNQSLKATNRELEAQNSFWIESFGRLDPNKDGRSVLVASVLDNWLEELKSPDSGFSDRSRGRLLAAIGSAYLSLGLFEQSIEVLRLADPLVDPSTELQAILNANLSDSLISFGRLNEAAPLLEANIQRGDTMTTINSKCLLAIVKADTGKLTQAVEMMKVLYDSESFETLAAIDQDQIRHNYGYVLVQSGRYKEAIEILLKCLESTDGEQRRVPFPETRQLLARAYLSVGQLDKAESLSRRVAEEYVESHGPSHKLTLQSKNTLAGVYMRRGEMAKAAEILQPLREEFLKAYGEKFPNTIGISLNLGMARFYSGETARAEELLEFAYEGMLELAGASDRTTQNIQQNLSTVLIANKKYKRAQLLLESLINLQTASGKTTDRKFANLHCKLGESFVNSQQYVDAITPLRVALKKYGEQSNSEWQRGKAESLLGYALCVTSEKNSAEHDEGLGLLREGWASLQSHADTIPVYLRSACLADARQRVERCMPKILN